MKNRYSIIIDKKRCKGCLLCVMSCPGGVLMQSEEFNQKGYHPVKSAGEDRCTGCNFCYIMCPDLAIGVIEKR